MGYTVDVEVSLIRMPWKNYHAAPCSRRATKLHPTPACYPKIIHAPKSYQSLGSLSRVRPAHIFLVRSTRSHVQIVLKSRERKVENNIDIQTMHDSKKRGENGEKAEATVLFYRGKEDVFILQRERGASWFSKAPDLKSLRDTFDLHL